MENSGNEARSKGFFRYLAVPPSDRAWGLWITGTGYTLIGPGSPYPPNPHPAGYRFEWNRGRVLQEFQVVYLSRGGGIYEDEAVGQRTIAAGDCFLLRPGVWHRYRPEADQGWDEHWFACTGPVAARILAEPFFAVDQPVLVHGLDPDLVDAFRAMAELAAELPSGHGGSLAALAYRIVARLHARRLAPHPADDGALVREAICRLHADLNHPVSIPGLAQELGVAYDHLRRAFKAQTGQSPKQYLQTLRLRHAQDLLSRSDATLATIAEHLGFGSGEHLSRLFSRHLGLSPGRWRQQRADPRRQPDPAP